MESITKRIKGVLCHKIICQRCGKGRWVKSQNWKQVKLCKLCAYEKRRVYNTDYIRKQREERKEVVRSEKGISDNNRKG